MSDLPELKPCPFCGSKVIMERFLPHPDYLGYRWLIRCPGKDCFAQGIPTWETKERCVSTWNRRTE